MGASFCFNGAVTFSLRKYHDRVLEVRSSILLQWGRNFFVTEIYTLQIYTLQVCTLQWGRNFFVTEIL